MLNCRYVDENGKQVFYLSGRLDHEGYETFEANVRQNYVKGRDVWLDLHALTYISSIGLRSFIMLAKLVRAERCQIYVSMKDESLVKRVIDLSGFAKLMQFV